MTRIETTFATLQANGKKALIPYVMAGDPKPSVTVDLLHDLVKHGADMIELGLPFSDPMADGETIALAGERALAGGTSTRQAIEMVAKFRKNDQDTPIILMGYLNPVEIIGYDNFITLCTDAGVDGLLMVDLPAAEAGNFTKQLADKQINEIFLLSPTTLPERRQQVLKSCGGYIYYVSLKGVTGSASLDTNEVGKQVQAIKADTALPVCVGFGIRDGASAKAIGQYADGVIVGSELVKNFANVGDDNGKIEQAKASLLAKMDELRLALDSLER
ncbi:tryptophan synthase subunit alpha [Psychrobacter sp. I-STPA6b]|uniref:tryptophan synthase subunit alpha n=1 Tax=Psychrobacter sp. I-STPA6b TaxID=2585718 RepID=UPI001D0C9FAF|nr:tryptophan synthase subunit alpha [Psychrobacter sp. I-STPA6b]